MWVDLISGHDSSPTPSRAPELALLSVLNGLLKVYPNAAGAPSGRFPTFELLQLLLN